MADYTYSVTINDAQQKAFEYVASDPQEWVRNLVHERCRMAIEEICAAEIARMQADPNITSIPADKEQIVRDAEILSAAQRNEISMQELPGAGTQ
jgi:hypothetical protein